MRFRLLMMGLSLIVMSGGMGACLARGAAKMHDPMIKELMKTGSTIVKLGGLFGAGLLIAGIIRAFIKLPSKRTSRLVAWLGVTLGVAFVTIALVQ